MAALAHLGVGLAAKRVATEIPVGYLVLGAYALDFLWFASYFAGIEQHPKRSYIYPTVWTHSLLMATVWSGLAAMVAICIIPNTRAGVVFGLVVFSHWAVDFITHPMTALAPQDEGLPLAFYGSPRVGLGMYRTMFGVYAGEFGMLALGIIVYIFARRRLKRINAPQASVILYWPLGLGRPASFSAAQVN